MKKEISKVLLITASIVLIFTSCTKINDPSPATTSTNDVDSQAAQVASANDQTNTSSATDLALNDVNGLISASCSSARLELDTIDYDIIKNSTSSTLSGIAKELHINYKGTSHFGRIRTGSVIVTLISGDHFSDINATWTVSFTGYSVKLYGDADSNVVTLNGLHTVTNLTGGLVKDVFNSGLASVVHQTIGTSMLTFGKDGTTRDWQVARKLTYTNTNGVIGFKIEGIGSADGYSNLSEWGTNRHGNKFYTSVTTPIESSSVCGLHKPFAGSRIHTLVSNDGSFKITCTETITQGDNCENVITITFINRKGETITKSFLVR